MSTNERWRSADDFTGISSEMKGEFVGLGSRLSIGLCGFPKVMPRQPIEKYYSEKELHQMVSRINAFASEYSPWKFTHARKEHQDLFGDVIKPGEYYFKHGSGPAFDDVIKLSAPSMEKLCFALFESAIFLKPLANQIMKQRQKRMFEAVSKLSSVGNHKDEKNARSSAKRNR